MLRGLSIVICSLVLASSGVAQTMSISLGVAHYSTFTVNTATNWTAYGISWGILRSSGTFSVNVPATANYYTWRDTSGNTTNGVWGQIPVSIVRSNGGGTLTMSNNQWTLTAGTNVITGTAMQGSVPAPTPTPTPTPSPTPTPAPSPTPSPSPGQMQQYSMQFNPADGWAVGTKVQIKDVNGNVMLEGYVEEDGLELTGLAPYDGVWTVEANGVKVGTLVPAEAGGLELDLASGTYPGGVESANMGISFPANMAGYQWQVRRPDGTIAAAGIAPAGGGSVGAAVTFAMSTGGTLQVRPAGSTNPFEDTGVSLSSGNSWSAGVVRPGSNLAYGSGAVATEWQIQRQDGSIAAAGPITAGGGTIVNNFFAPAGTTSELYVKEDLGDGMGSVWVPTGITYSGSGGTTSGTVPIGTTTPNPVPSPTPFPSPAPSPTPLPSPVGPGQEPAYGGGAGSNEMGVPVDVPQAVVPDDDLGEEAVFDVISDMQDDMQTILNNHSLALAQIGMTFDQLRLLVIPPPGQTCSFQLGPYSINLSPPAGIREGSKLLFLIVGVFGFYRMIMDLFNG